MAQRVKILMSCLAFIAPTAPIWAVPASGPLGLVQVAAEVAAKHQYNQKHQNGQNPGATTTSNFGPIAPIAPVANTFGPKNKAGSSAPSQDQEQLLIR